jgi:hypothetical protein
VRGALARAVRGLPVRTVERRYLFAVDLRDLRVLRGLIFVFFVALM